MRKAFSYIRFSTPDQAKGDSFRRQTEFSQKYAEKHGLVLDESTSIRDLGVSAFRSGNVKEGALAGFLQLARGGKVPKGSVLIVESLDRLSRDQIRPALQLFLGILDSGISIVTVNPEREYTPDDQDPVVLIEPLIYFSRAHEESATKSRRVGESWDARRKKAVTEQKAMTTVGPKWLHTEEGKFVPVTERVRLVQDIFRWTLEGLGTYAIVKKLTEDKVPGWGSGKWNTAYVRLILSDRRVLGEYQPKKLIDGKMKNHGDPIPNYYPRVVNDKDFYEALGTIKKRKGKAGRGGAGRDNVLAGLVYNAEDGSKMYYGTHRFRKPFLESTAGYYGGKRPKGASFPYEPIERAVLTILTEIKPQDENNVGGEDRVPELEGRLGDIKGRLSKLMARASAAEDFDAFLDVIEKLEGDKKQVLAELEEVKLEKAARSAEPLAETKTMIEMRKDLSGEGREKLNANLRVRVDSLVESVWILIEGRGRVEKTAHIQVYFKNGKREYQVMFHPTPPLHVNREKDYSDTDFKANFQERKKSST